MGCSGVHGDEHEESEDLAATGFTGEGLCEQGGEHQREEQERNPAAEGKGDSERSRDRDIRDGLLP